MRPKQTPETFFLYAMVSMLFFSFQACLPTAQIHPGRMAKLQEDPQDLHSTPLRISVQRDRNMSDNDYKLLHVTLENTSSEWIRPTRSFLDFKTRSKNTKIVMLMGKDIATWFESTMAKKRIESDQRQALLTSLSLIGFGVALPGEAANSQKTHAVGVVLQDLANLTLETSMTIEMFQAHYDSLEKSSMFPEDHLLAEGLAIPPKRFVRKWLLFQVSDQDWKNIENMVFVFDHWTYRLEVHSPKKAKSPEGRQPAIFRNHKPDSRFSKDDSL